MKILPVIFTILPLWFSPSAQAGLRIGGVGVGNGGDAVDCWKADRSPFQGVFALDFLMTLEGDGSSDAVPVDSWTASVQRIDKLLSAKYPAMLPSFRDFLRDLDNKKDWTRKRIWLPAPHGLLNLRDEEMSRKLPENCAHAGPNPGEIGVLQAAVRVKRPNIIQYEFDSKLLEELLEQPLQYSFLIIHEWLWDHTDDPKIIRWANQFLHSRQAERLGPEEFKKSLNRIGISSGYSGFWDVCDRTIEVRKAIEQLTKKACLNLTQADLDQIESLSTAYGTSTELNVNDLNGLSRLREFSLYSLPITAVPREFFAKNPFLEKFSAYNLPAAFNIDLSVFADHQYLRSITFGQIPLQSVPEDLLSFLPPQVQRFEINSSRLTTLPDQFFRYARNKQCTFEFRGSLISRPEADRIKQRAKEIGVERVIL